MSRIKRMECCCCGNSCWGRQWWNRDTGYGLCNRCADWQESRGTDAEEMRDLYGESGKHYRVRPDPA